MQKTLIAILVYLGCCYGSVKFRDADEIIPYPANGSSKRSSVSFKDEKSRSSSKKPKGDFDSDEEEEDIFDRMMSNTSSKKSYSPSKASSTDKDVKAVRQKPLKIATKESMRKRKEEQSKPAHVKTQGNPLVKGLWDLFGIFSRAFSPEYKNEFVTDLDEFNFMAENTGAVGSGTANEINQLALKEPMQKMLRIGRPLTWLMVNMFFFYDFPHSSGMWGLGFIINFAILAVWKIFDEEWMLTEMAHWDYALGLAVFLASGVVSLLHQGLDALSMLFSYLAPSAVVSIYLGLLLYAAFKKPHQYYA